MITDEEIDIITQKVVEAIKHDYFLTPRKLKPSMDAAYEMMEYTLAFIADHENIDVTELKSGNHRKRYIVPRYVFYHLLNKYFSKNISYTMMGAYTGGKSHATIVYALRTVRDRYTVDREYRTWIDQIEQAYLEKHQEHITYYNKKNG